jgi:hypothetical protein
VFDDLLRQEGREHRDRLGAQRGSSRKLVTRDEHWLHWRNSSAVCSAIAPKRTSLPPGGRTPKLTDEDIEDAKAMLVNPDVGVSQIAHRLGVSPATLYRYLSAARTANLP